MSHSIAIAWLIVASAVLGFLSFKHERVRTIVVFSAMAGAAFASVALTLWAITDIIK